jgi:hypothetical protein
MHKATLSLCALAALLVHPLAASAAPIAPGYEVDFVATPDTATGDVVAAGDALFVGVGPFGVGAQSLVRIDAGGVTVLATGWNALGGFAYDAANDRLIVGDNGGSLSGATTGDTLYAIPDPFGAPATPAAAADLELLPAGSIPGYADVVLDPGDPTGDTLFASDASESFPFPLGAVLQVSALGASAVPIQTGLDFAAGLAVGADTLFVGESLLDFSGQVSQVALADPAGALAVVAGGLDGLFDLELASDGTLLASAGDSIVRIDPADGSVASVATGFGFAAGLFERDGTIYAIDGFAASGDLEKVWVLTPVPEPGTLRLLAAGLGAAAFSARGRRGRRSGPAPRARC